MSVLAAVAKLQNDLWTGPFRRAIESTEDPKANSPDRVAERVGVDRKTWYNYQAGRTSPTVETLWRICGVLGLRLRLHVVSAAEAGSHDTAGADMHTPMAEIVANTMDKMDLEHQRAVLSYVQGYRAGSANPPEPHASRAERDGVK